MDPSEPTDRLVVGIDFGTTYSGVAYSYSANPDKPDDIDIIRQWPGGKAFTSDKVPSELAYGPSDSLSRHTSLRQSTTKDISKQLASRPGAIPTDDIFFFAKLNISGKNGKLDVPRPADDQTRWGFLLKPDESRLRCMKLFLETGQELPSYVSSDDTLAQLERWDKDPLTAVADYLTELFKHAKTALTNRYGELFMKTTPIEVILTVPAMWSDRAKDATRKAAQEAGMGRKIRMISEPEAAAVYTLQAIQPNHLRVGDNFVVCDAGGGTVDLISYEIKQTNPLRIQEVVRGTGACCGAAFLNIEFEKYVRSKLGDEQFATLCLKQPRGWRAALKYFEEYVKRNYDPDEDTEFNIPFPGAPDNEAADIDQGFLNISSEAIGQLFRPILQQITALVEQQMNKLQDLRKTVNGIVLVGGFGQSICLFKHLQSTFGGIAPPPPYPGSYSRSDTQRSSVSDGFEIMQPPNGWTAVARGAVLRGLEGAEIVLKRKSRRNYGVFYTDNYDEKKHLVSEKYWDELEECWKVSKRMRWFIEKEQTCSSTEPILFSFANSFERDTRRSARCSLIVCDDDDPPDVFDDGRNSPTRLLCSLLVDLDTVPKSLWKEKTNSKGQKYKQLSYNLGMQIESGGLRFDLRVDDTVYGDVVAEFDCY